MNCSTVAEFQDRDHITRLDYKSLQMRLANSKKYGHLCDETQWVLNNWPKKEE